MEYEYIVYGGFDVVLKALQSVALIFSDGDYISLFWTLATFGLGATIISYYFGALFGRNTLGLFEWAQTYWWAIFFFFALIAPAGTLHVYDAHKNRYQSVGNLPVGIVLVAGTLNKIEVGLTDMINTAMSPVISYEDAGNGQGVDMIRELYGFVQKNFRFPDKYDQQTLDEYIVECYLYGVLSGDISENDFRNDQDLLNNTFGQANYLNVYTLVYSDANRKGATSSCQDAYSYLQSRFTAAYLNGSLENQFCSKMGYSTSSPQEITRCKEVLQGHLQELTNYTGADPSFVLTQMYISQYINNIMLEGNPVEAAQFVGTREAASGMMGVGLMANEFIPIFRSVMLALSFAITPLLFLFISTFALEAFGYFLGTMIWLTVWGVMDVVLHNFAMSYAYDMFASIRDSGTSFISIFSFDEYSAKVLSVMGYMRVLGLMLSSSIVFGIIKFGGEAFARAAGSMQGTVEGAGKAAGGSSLTAEGKSAYASNLDRGIGTMGSLSSYTPQERWNRHNLDNSTATSTATKVAGAYDGSVHGAAEAVGQGNALGTVSNAEAAQKKIAELGGMEGAVNTISDSIARGDISKGRETAKLLAHAGGMGHLTEREATASANNAMENIAKTNTKFAGLGQALGVSPLAASEYYGGWVGAKDAGEASAILNDGARSMIDTSMGTDSGSFEKYAKALRRASTPEEFKNSIASDENLKKIDDAMIGGSENAPLMDRAKAIDEKLEGARADLAGQMGGYKGIKDIGEHQQVLNKMKALGLGDDLEGRRQLAQFESKGLLSKGMAEFLNNKYDTGFFAEGTQFKEWGVDHNGDAMVARAMRTEMPNDDHKGRNLAWDNGGINEKGSMDKEQLLKEAALRENAGDAVTAQGLRMTAGNMKNGEAAEYAKSYAQDGRSLNTAEYKHGSGAVLYDTATRREGLDDKHLDTKQHYIGTDGEANQINNLLKGSGYDTSVKKGDMVTMSGRAGSFGADADFLKNAKPGDLAFTKIDRGVVRSDNDIAKEESGSQKWSGKRVVAEDTNKSSVDHGVDIGSAMQMALARDQAIASFVSDPTLNKYKLNANIAETSKDLGEDMGKWLSRNGLSVGSSEGSVDGSISAGTGLKILGTGGGISANLTGRIGRRSQESESVNLLSSEYDKRIRQSVSEARVKGLNKEETENYVAGKIGDFTQGLYDQARNAKSLDYGADAPVGAAKRVLEKVPMINPLTQDIIKKEKAD